MHKKHPTEINLSMDKEVSLDFFFFSPLHVCTGILRNPMQVSISPSSHLTLLSECLGHKVERVCSTALVESSQHLRYHRLNLTTPECTFQHCSPASYTQGLHVPLSGQMGQLWSLNWFLRRVCFPHNAPTTALAQYLPGWKSFLLFYQVFLLQHYNKCPKTQELRATQNSINY